MALPASDNFNRASLGANWTLTLNTMAINASTDYVGQVSVDTIATWNADVYGNDQESSVTITAISANTHYCGVVVRSSGGTGYVFFTDGGSGAGHTSVQTYNGATFTNVKDIVTTFAVNDTMKLRIQGTTWTVFKNGVQIDTGTDSTKTSGGTPGIYAFNNTGRGDNWTGDNFPNTVSGARRWPLYPNDRNRKAYYGPIARRPIAPVPSIGTVYDDVLTEAVSAADAVSSLNSAQNATSEAVSAGDALTHTALVANGLTEAGAATDTGVNTLILVEGISDSGAASDAVSGGLSLTGTLSESGSSADSLANVLNALNVLTDAVAANDASVSQADAQNALSEPVSAADDVSATGGTTGGGTADNEYYDRRVRRL